MLSEVPRVSCTRRRDWYFLDLDPYQDTPLSRGYAKVSKINCSSTGHFLKSTAFSMAMRCAGAIEKRANYSAGFETLFMQMLISRGKSPPIWHDPRHQRTLGSKYESAYAGYMSHNPAFLRLFYPIDRSIFLSWCYPQIS